MKTFSKDWIRSKKPSKQRKFRANAPLHIKRSFISAHLAKPLREKHGRRAITLRKGDSVKIMRGQFKGKAGKVERINIRREEVFVAGIETKKLDGTKSFYPIHPSKVMITGLILDDKKRLKAKTPEAKSK